MKYKDKWALFQEYVATHDTVTGSYITGLTYNSVKGILKRYTKGTGVQFEYIGNDTYVILK